MQLFKKYCLMLVMLVMVAACQQRVDDSPQNISALNDAARNGDAAALAKLTALAENGNAVAQLALGFFSSEDALGVFSSQELAGVDPDRSTFWYRKSAEQGNPVAQKALARMYESGKQGVPEDLVMAYMLRKLAFIPGESREEIESLEKRLIPAQLAEAQEMVRAWKPNKSASQRFQASSLFLYNSSLMKSPIIAMAEAAGGGDTAALAKLEALSNKGDKIAQLRLGSLYYSGNGVPKDAGRAVSLYRKSAEQDLYAAQEMLGSMYYEGYGVPQDYAQAAFWYRKSAERGSSTSQYALGGMYRDGEGVPKDWVISYMWFNLAAAQAIQDKSNQAYTARRHLHTHGGTIMTADEVAKAQKLSREWKPKPF